MIDICAIGPLRVTSGLYNAGLLQSGAKVNLRTHQEQFSTLYLFVGSNFTFFIFLSSMSMYVDQISTTT